MPELQDVPDFVTEIAEQEKQRATAKLPGLSSDFVRKDIAPLYPEIEFIGKGTHCIVIGAPGKADQVVAFGFRQEDASVDPFEAGEKYHSHRVLSILFPEHFPRFHAVQEGEENWSVRHKIVINPEEEVDEKRAGEIKADIQAKAAELSILVYLDAATENYVIDEDGNQIYIDVVLNNSRTFQYADVAEILEHIERCYGTDSKDESERKAAVKKIRRMKIEVLGSLRRLREIAILKEASVAIINSKRNPLDERWFRREVDDFKISYRAEHMTEDKISARRIQKLTNKLYDYWQGKNFITD